MLFLSSSLLSLPQLSGLNHSKWASWFKTLFINYVLTINTMNFSHPLIHLISYQLFHPRFYHAVLISRLHSKYLDDSLKLYHMKNAVFLIKIFLNWLIKFSEFFISLLLKDHKYYSLFTMEMDVLFLHILYLLITLSSIVQINIDVRHFYIAKEYMYAKGLPLKLNL